MAKYAEGNYLILTFDRYGTKIETRLAELQGLIGAQKEGEKLIGGDVASFSVLRVLINSIDRTAEKWQVKS